MASACSTLFISNRLIPTDLAERYEEIAEPANGYLTCLESSCVLVDAQASETADWARQVELATALCEEDMVALSIFIVGDLWALTLSRDGLPGPVAAFTPDNPKTVELLPRKLLEIEQQLVALFPDTVDAQEVDTLLGAMLEGAICPEEGIGELVEMLGGAHDWLRWSWYETIPEQLFIDPDLADRVIPLGDARILWEE